MPHQHEVVVQVIEPVEPPAPLTARPRLGSLMDHLSGFLNANNRNGFAPIDTASLDLSRIGDRMVLVASERELTTLEFKHHAWEIKKLSGGAVKVHMAYDLMAILFGYRDFHSHARLDLERLGKVFNQRDAAQVANDLFGVGN